MRKNNKKGFTIVELVIVIAVIAILAGVLIPTFAGVVSKANASKALQEAQNAIKVVAAEYAEDGKAITSATIYCYDKGISETNTKIVYTIDFDNGVAGEAVKATESVALPAYVETNEYYANSAVVVKEATNAEADDAVNATAVADLAKNIIVVVTASK